jgi:tRNA(fMet)-specific endonuclease VapC
VVTIRYLLDANIISEPLRPSPLPPVIARLQEHASEFALASVVWHELWYGCYRLPPSAKRTAIEAYLREVIAPSTPILPYDEAAAAWHAAERSRLTALGQPPPFADGQIAATAATHGLLLVTFNASDFAAFRDLQIVDWRAV